MDLSGIVIVLLGSVLFFGFIVWMAIVSRRNNRKLNPDRSENKYFEIGKRQERVLKN